MQTQITPRCVIKEETENIAKNLSAALQAEIDPLNNQFGYMDKQETLQT